MASMEPEPSRPSPDASRVVAGAVAAIVVGMAGVVWLASVDEPSARTVESPWPAPVVEEPRTGFASAGSASAVDAAARSEAPGEMQVCGGAWVKLGDDGLPDKDELAGVFARATDEVGATAMRVMATSGSPRSQAAALYLRVGLAQLPASTGADCSAAACVRRREAAKADVERQRDALARLAQDTHDPQIYAWAYRACKAVNGSPQGSCAFINVGQWTYLDPALADPWLAAVAEARARKDGAGAEDALFHVAHAERVDLGFAALAAEVLKHVPADDATLPGLFGLLTQAAAVEASRISGLVSTAESCREEELADANRRETCERIAGVMTERSTNAYPRYLGSELGKRLGWSPDRIDALERERDAAQAAVERQMERAAEDPQACGTFRFEVDRVRGIARWGELETNRRQVAASGRSTAELASEARRRRAEGAAQARREDAAASAAAAASATNLASR